MVSSTSSQGPARSFSASELRQAVMRLLGKRGVAALVSCLVATATLAGVELLIAALIQTLLSIIGVLDMQSSSEFLRWTKTWSLPVAGGALVGVGALRFVCTFTVLQVGAFTAEVVATRLRLMAVHDLLNPPPGTIAPNSLFQFRITELVSKSYLVLASGTAVIAHTMQTCVLLILMIITAWRESTLAVASLLVLGIGLRYVQRAIRGISVKVPALGKQASQSVERVARNRIFVRLMRMEDREFTALSRLYVNYSRHMLRNLALGNTIGGVTPLLGIIVIVGVLATSGRVWHTPGESLLLFLYLLFRFVQSAQIAVGASASVQANIPQFRMALEFVSSLSERSFEDSLRHEPLVGVVGAGQPLPPAPVEPPRLDGASDGGPPALNVKDVVFTYPGGAAPVLDRVSLSVAPGEQFAIVGPSGVGKSTLLMLLLGILRPDRGSVTLDGEAPEVWCNQAQGRIGYVGAEPFLVQGTLRDNLLYGVHRHVSDEELVEALRFAKLQSMADGLDRTVTEDLQGFSAGQKQRICLARAVLTRPRLLILDEVSANLDEATEKDIATSINALKGRCTTVIVTHRKGMLLHADQVYSFETTAPNVEAAQRREQGTGTADLRPGAG